MTLFLFFARLVLREKEDYNEISSEEGKNVLYDAYIQRIQKWARVRDKIYRWRYLIVAVLSVCLLLLSLYWIFKGSFLQPLSLEQTDLVYGEQPKASAKALFSSVRYEYKDAYGTWSEQSPKLPGQYAARSVSVGSFGKEKYSEEVPFQITPLMVELTALPADTTWTDEEGTAPPLVYGEWPVVGCVSLPYGDIMMGAEFRHEDQNKLALGNTFGHLGYLPDEFGYLSPFWVKADTVRVFSQDGTEVTAAYRFTSAEEGFVFAYLPRVVTVTADSATKVYDGTPLTAPGWRAQGALESDGLSCVVEGERTAVGTSKNRITVRKFGPLDQKWLDPANHHVLRLEHGTLEVTPRELTIATGSMEAYYTGRPVSCSDYQIILGELAPGETLRVVAAREETEVGDYINTMAFEVIGADGVSVTTKNYKITCLYGTLKILPKIKVTVTPMSLSKVYDGKPLRYLSDDWWTISEDALLEGHTYELSLKLSGEITRVGELPAQIEVLNVSFWDEHHRPVDYYELVIMPATLTVKPAIITVCSPTITTTEREMSVTIDTEDLILGEQVVLPEGYRLQCINVYTTTATLDEKGYYHGEVRTSTGELLWEYIAELAEIAISPFVILDPQGQDATLNFTIFYRYGYLILGESTQ